MKTLSLALLLTLLAWHVAAQTDKPVTNWKTLVQPDDEFSLEVPAGFEFGMPGLPFDKIKARGEFHSDSDRFYFFIDSPKDLDQRKQVEAFLKYSKQDTSEMNLAENVAVRADFEDSTGYFHRVIFVKTQKRIFTLQTVSLTKKSDNTVRFLSSFSLKPKAMSPAVPVQPESIEKTADDPVLVIDLTQAPTQADGRGGGIGSGSGQGSGSGAGYGSAKAAPGGTAAPSPTPRVTAPLRLLYKQKASYTDFARFYAVQGTVTLRVTFLASGEIGSIVPIKKLPFGLTEASTYAARQMRFEPEMVNGVARHTSRPVSFSFSIY